ncbi:MAG TPA: DPP IV N-terminal domain-containing protein [Candidatus Limnocylindrales bacterium]|nr:DPP IV N-terminal domain-containing protein [Candidatus Limnocylindrales bacterium]
MPKRIALVGGAAFAALLWFAPIAGAQLSQNLTQWMRRINSGEFSGGAGGGRGAGGRGGRGAGSGRWLDGGTAYAATEPGDGGAMQRFRIDTATAERRQLPAEPSNRPPGMDRALAGGTASADGQELLFATNPRTVMIRKTASDYWVLDKHDNSWHKLAAHSTGGLLFAKFSPDGKSVAYLGDPHPTAGALPKYNLYVEEIATGALRQLTSDATDDLIDGTSDWVNNEEFGLADCFHWSPDGSKIAYYQFDQSGVPEFALINYTDALYPIITKYKYPKPGQKNAAVRVGVVNATGGPTRWLKTPGDPRNTYIPDMEWTADNHVILQHMNRLQNTNTVFLANPDTGDLRQIFQDKDDAWVEVNRNLRWIEGGRRFLFTSERDGWRHVYAVSLTGDARRITTEPFDLVSIAAVDEPGGWLYFIASPENGTQRYLYRARLDGSKTERVTPSGQPGTHTYDISPDAHWAFHTVSTFNSPGESDLVSLPDHKVVRVLNDNAALKAKVSPILAGRTEMVHIPVGHDTTIDGWLIRPSKFDPSRKYPIIINVYGEPASSTVNDSWGGNNRMLMAALADDGYLVASFDNSGTPSPKGRHWRKVIYGSVGVLASQEQADALRGLAATHPYVDLTRVGVFGWSGGGSMTLNLMFRFPDLYSVGVAGAPVADQALYDTIYQERYMGLPADNAKGYHDGSPISYAEGLKGKLLIVHGTGDDNVHFQGTQRLLNKLISLNKQFHFMEYPNRRHGVQGSDPVHLDTLRYGFFEEYLPAGPR